MCPLAQSHEHLARQFIAHWIWDVARYTNTCKFYLYTANPSFNELIWGRWWCFIWKSIICAGSKFLLYNELVWLYELKVHHFQAFLCINNLVCYMKWKFVYMQSLQKLHSYRDTKTIIPHQTSCYIDICILDWLTHHWRKPCYNQTCSVDPQTYHKGKNVCYYLCNRR